MPAQTIRCNTWEEFCAVLRIADGSPLEPIYRGHALSRWPLVAPSQRDEYEQVTALKRLGENPSYKGSEFNRGQVTYFKHLATGMPGVDITSLSEIDLEAIARHHGLCSNLLDWTSSAYVAAFFAFTGALDRANEGRLTSGTISLGPILAPHEDVCVWRLGLRDELWKQGEFECHTTLSAVNFWQKAQRGLFTRLSHSDHADILSYLEAKGLADALTCFIVPGQETGTALNDLEAMNITYATLFPDLRGAALQANIGATWRFLNNR